MRVLLPPPPHTHIVDIGDGDVNVWSRLSSDALASRPLRPSNPLPRPLRAQRRPPAARQRPPPAPRRALRRRGPFGAGRGARGPIKGKGAYQEGGLPGSGGPIALRSQHTRAAGWTLAAQRCAQGTPPRPRPCPPRGVRDGGAFGALDGALKGRRPRPRPPAAPGAFLLFTNCYLGAGGRPAAPASGPLGRRCWALCILLVVQPQAARCPPGAPPAGRSRRRLARGVLQPPTSPAGRPPASLQRPLETTTARTCADGWRPWPTGRAGSSRPPPVACSLKREGPATRAPLAPPRAAGVCGELRCRRQPPRPALPPLQHPWVPGAPRALFGPPGAPLSPPLPLMALAACGAGRGGAGRRPI